MRAPRLPSGSSRTLWLGFGVLLAVVAGIVLSAVTVAHMDRAGPTIGPIPWIVGLGIVGLAVGVTIAVAVTRQVARSERALALKKELAEVTLQSIGDGVITTDAEGRVEYLNPVAERYTEWITDEARGRPLQEIYRVIDERTAKTVDPSE